VHYGLVMTPDTSLSRPLADRARSLARHSSKLRVSLVSTFLLALACGSSPDGNAEKVGWTSEPVTVCAGGSTVEGVDVSEFQGSIDWNAVHGSGRGFAIARVSDGTGHSDPTFAANWAGIKAAGMVRGVYQFFRGSESGTAQADLLVSAIGSLGAGDLPPVADVEVSDGVSGATLVASLAAWVGEIKAKTGVTPMIYTAPGFWNGLPSTGQFAGEVMWVANWQVSCPDVPTPWTGWTFWQYDDGQTTANCPGISGAVDKDRYNGTLAQLTSIGGPRPYAAQFVSQSFPLASTALTMVEGQVIPSYIELKNVGSKTWDSSTHLGTTQPRDRKSVFADSTWLGPNRPAGVTGTVPPGSSYKFKFDLAAPATAGTYHEYFGVVQEGVAWFSDPGQGGPPDNDLEVQVKVVAPKDGPPDAGAPRGDGGTGVKPPTGGDGGTGLGGPSGDDGGVASGDTDGGGDGGWSDNASSGSTGGCSVGSQSGPAPGWAVGLGLLFVLVPIRRRSKVD
jgi:lysozyme